jgi:hypothetical protein
LSELAINHPDILMGVRVVSGLLMKDGRKADNKIIGLLKDEASWKNLIDMNESLIKIIERLDIYFITCNIKIRE